ncbi:MAG: hypothetical protein AAF614_39940 [Chloroflexota bacterium]
MLIRSTQQWELLDENNEALASGSVANLEMGANGVNLVRFIVHGQQAALYVNGIEAGSFVFGEDVSNVGDFRIATGFLAGHEVTGFETCYEDFVVWEISEATESSEKISD